MLRFTFCISRVYVFDFIVLPFGAIRNNKVYIRSHSLCHPRDEIGRVGEGVARRYYSETVPEEFRLYGSGTFRILLLFPGLRRYVYLVRRGAGCRT